MIYLEIIEIRSTQSSGIKLAFELKELAKEVNKKEEEEIMKVYEHTKIKNEFSVHIEHASDKIFKRSSRLGLTIISSFKKYGLINHNIWIKQSNQEY